MRHMKPMLLLAAVLLGGCLSDDKTATAPDSPNTPGTPYLTLTPRSGAVTVSWQAVANATGYRIYWRDAYNAQNLIDVGTALSYDHTGLQPGQTYYYQVVGVGVNGEGPRSPEQGAVVPLPQSALKDDSAP